MNRMLLTALAALMLAGCQREANDYLSINGKIFIFNVRLSKAYYTLNLNRLADVPDGSMVTAEFENPAGGPPLSVTKKVFPNMTRIDFQSPDLDCIVADKPYAITITLRAPDGKEMQRIKTTLASTLDQTVMPEQALVRGNAYDKNPTAYDATGHVKFRKACGAQG
ncbi:hypothetical protein M2360_002177 [Rhizobium sp. SG_E_25_P2]|uniref:lipoprotein n=1 Tax=Rhizobium sp. SG_E_25_P2 TaxID=2879942 RepID=UPI00247720EC|nr:lipoprotein [Rhizobium sp. SG_E_25_P2]MDH6266781.1 hypothetical protein [Rhizobium sp. SG_E_25_P2]